MNRRHPYDKTSTYRVLDYLAFLICLWVLFVLLTGCPPALAADWSVLGIATQDTTGQGYREPLVGTQGTIEARPGVWSLQGEIGAQIVKKRDGASGWLGTGSLAGWYRLGSWHVGARGTGRRLETDLYDKGHSLRQADLRLLTGWERQGRRVQVAVSQYAVGARLELKGNRRLRVRVEADAWYKARLAFLTVGVGVGR